MFTTEQSSIKRHGIIVKIASPGRYIIEDQAGRRFPADGDEGYKVGRRVVVRDSLITGKSGITSEPRRYEV